MGPRGLGIACALLFRNRDPAPTVKRYSWEGEDDDSSEQDNYWDHDETDTDKNK